MKPIYLAASCVLLTLACKSAPAVDRSGPCDSDNAGLQLKQGYCARVFADNVGQARHIVVAKNGDVWVAMLGRDGGILALRDRNGDGRADTSVVAFHQSGSGIAIHGDTLWFSTQAEVYRFRIDPRQFGRLYDRKTIVQDMPTGGHSARSLTLGDSSDLFVTIGSEGNICDSQDPCVELSTRAAIWRFHRNIEDQSTSSGERFASGIRNAVGLYYNTQLHQLFATQHGRDLLPDEDLPSEEFVRVTKGADFGWPYCYHDWRMNKMVLSPEFGGDGTKQGRCTNATQPLVGFPGHWAPNGLIFWNGGALIAFHGSWNRRHQDGYRVVYVPFKGADVAGKYEIFADGFAGKTKSPSGAEHRPVGLAVANDGSVYITDDQRGRIYNVRVNAKDDSAGRR